MNDLLLRLRALFLKNRVEGDLDEELGFHIEMQTRKNLAAGMSAAEAKRQARIQFGVGDAVKEECRDARRVGFIETLLQDIRYALRGFRRTPLFALSVVSTISLGLGWTIAVFTIFNAYVLRPPAVHDPESLNYLDWTDRTGSHGFTWNQYENLRAAGQAFTQVSAWCPVRTRMNAHFARGLMVSGDWFGMVGVPALMGRTLLPAEARSPGTEPVLVLSYAAWQSRFASDPAILGRKTIIHGHPFEVIGVMPESFTGLDVTHPSDFWVPITMSSLLGGPNLFDPLHAEPLGVAGRRKPHVSVQQALAGLTVWARGAERLPADARIVARPVSSLMGSKVHRTGVFAALVLLFTPFLVVLLSACANVANMMLARAMARQREIGIRLSLGAARGRLIRQLLTEAMLLAFPAALGAVGISQAMISMGVMLLFATIPANFGDFIHLAPITPDARVFGFALAAAISSALLFGLAPAIQATRLNIMQAAHGDFSGEFRPSRVRSGLVVGQVTVSALFLIVCGVFLRGANHVRSLDLGMRTRDVLEIEIQEKSRPQVLGQLAADSGVGPVAAAANAPLDSTLPAAGAGDGAELVRIPYTYSSPEYFEVFEIPIVRGRNFTSEETAGAAVAILSETAARKLWPNLAAMEGAVGRSIRLEPHQTGRGADRPIPKVVRVVGVARDTLVDVMSEDQGRACLYLTTGLKDPGNLFLARVQGDPEAAKQRLNVALDAEEPGTVERIDTMQAFVNVRDYPFRVVYWVSAALGGIALFFTLSGIYGVLSYTVAQRTKEIGIRLAMGANSRAVIGLILSQCMRVAAWGIAIGVALALAAAKFASAQVTIDPFDTTAFFGGTALVLAACICAAYIPARRAARIDPITTLRYD